MSEHPMSEGLRLGEQNYSHRLAPMMADAADELDRLVTEVEQLKGWTLGVV